MQKIDPKEYQKRLDRMTAMFADMVTQADAQSLTRCPYKNRFDRCTAQFGCRFQKRAEDEGLGHCTNDGTLDYRTAWESDPGKAQEMSESLRPGRRKKA